MSGTLQYRSSCHCQSVIFGFVADDHLENKEFILCSCSICTKNGYVNFYLPKSSIVFVRGEHELQKYSFHPHNRNHMFCPKCGASLLIIANEKIPDNGKIGVNLRSVEGLDVQRLKVRVVDGRSRRPEDEMREWAEQQNRSKSDRYGNAR